ncbi:hypothetical protein ACP4OV_023245 [Aristida adscensionis]
MSAICMLLLVLTAAVAWSSPQTAADTAGSQSSIGLQANCTTTCGDVRVPYPFGIDPGCYLPGFNLTCDTSHVRPRLFLGNGTLQVTDISLDNSTMRVLGPSISVVYVMASTGQGTWGGPEWGLVEDGPYLLREGRNEFVVNGCNINAMMSTLGDNITARDQSIVNSCDTTCLVKDMANHTIRSSGRCSGIGCCQKPILDSSIAYYITFFGHLDKEKYGINGSLIIAEEGWFDHMDSEQVLSSGRVRAIPAVLAWAVRSTVLSGSNETRAGNETCPRDLGTTMCHSNHSSCTGSVDKNHNRGYTCKCDEGFEGNPYFPGGCQDINECKLPKKCYGNCTNVPGSYLCQCPQGTSGDPYSQNSCIESDASHTDLIIGIGVGSGAGLIFIVIGMAILICQVKAQRRRRLTQRFFKQNRGQLLQQLVCHNADIAERMIITIEEIEKATNNFDKAFELGDGGHGTVYKGFLSSLHVVAIKKSKIVIQKEIDQFINEVAILSQVNHRNIVKLIGCCLETEVPLLVYEFISNGTLYSHLHVATQVSLSWKDRLRIAIETARAIAYLHSLASMPIIHRDIKSPNILLDDNLTVKLSDFGASRYISVDQTGVDTNVQGTFGYLDPMYHSTGHLTDKSDVYSFGVLLIELLTKKKPASYISPQGYNLVNHFVSLLPGGNLDTILDPQVTREGGGEIVDVALLAAICVKVVSVDRPTMRQVEMTLESIHATKEHASGDTTYDESEENINVNELSVGEISVGVTS